MARERDLASGRKDAQVSQCFVGSRFEHEDSFREIHLTRDLTHLIVGYSFGVGEDGEWIAGEGAVREHVELEKAIVRHGDRKEQTAKKSKSGGWSKRDGKVNR